MKEATTTNKPLRVLHVGKYFPPHRGGMETYLRDLMSVQKREGIKVMALVHSSKKAALDVRRCEDALDGTHFAIVESARWLNIGYVPISPFFAISAAKIIKNFKPDVIHMHLPNASAIWLLLIPSARKITWVCTWHSDVITPMASLMMTALYKFFVFFETALLRQCTRIFATSKPYAESSRPLTAHREKVNVVSLGLDLKRMPETDSVELAEKGDRLVIMCVGRLTKYKGTLDLINAIANLPDLELWIVGSGECEAQARRLVSSRILSHRVKFWGEVDQQTLWSLYKTCDLFCLASYDRAEAFGLVLYEAAYFGTKTVARYIPDSGVPVAARNAGGLSEEELSLEDLILAGLSKRQTSGAHISLISPRYDFTDQDGRPSLQGWE